eukprot:scaffold4778_cov142-Isochrysis_galbana.AAC.1
MRRSPEARTDTQAREQDAPGTHDAKRRAPVHGHTGDVPSDKALSDKCSIRFRASLSCSPPLMGPARLHCTASLTVELPKCSPAAHPDAYSRRTRRFQAGERGVCDYLYLTNTESTAEKQVVVVGGWGVGFMGGHSLKNYPIADPLLSLVRSAIAIAGECKHHGHPASSDKTDITRDRARRARAPIYPFDHEYGTPHVECTPVLHSLAAHS